MWTSLRILGSLTLALVLGSGVAFGGDLSNVTVGRFQDFTVVTLFGEGPLGVTHQIVEAKDGKPHRIVVDVTGALHRLPQNNFLELPEGSISAIRTSQFAVSPEPVVRVVLDLAHPAAYRLESPEGQIRLLVSLPGDPAMATTWSAREGTLPATGQTEPAIFAETEPATEAATTSDASQPSQEFASADPAATAAATATATATAAEPATVDAANADASPSEPASTEPSAAETTSETAVDAAGDTPEEQAAPAEAEPKAPATTSPQAAPASGGVEKALPLAATGVLAANEAASSEAPASETTAQTSQSSPEEAASSEQASSQAEPGAESAQQAIADPATPAAEAPTAGLAAHGDEPSASAAAEPEHADASAGPSAPSSDPWSNEKHAPEVPLPDPSKSQPERVIDYNLPMPASIAAANEAASGTISESQSTPAEAEPALESAAEPAGPKMAVKSAQDSEADPSASVELPTASGTDAAATDVGSAPVASLSTLPPIMESAEALMPERKQVIYHTHGKRDPFKALLTAGGYSAASLPDVSTLRLVGVLQDVMESWGLFEDANGYGYILRKGDRVKNGSLTQLTNNRAYFNLTEFGWSRSVHIDLEPEG